MRREQDYHKARGAAQDHMKKVLAKKVVQLESEQKENY
jgi:hypothetical protein